MGIVNSLPAGTVIRGREYTYRIEKKLGNGSYGITYLAQTVITGIRGQIPVKVALKEFFSKELDTRNKDGSVMPRPKSGYAYKYAQSFRRESEKLSRMDHSGIVKVLEDFEANGTYFYSMEYLPGGSLEDKCKGRALPEEEALSLISKIGEALYYMHGQKMMHLDLKPNNIVFKEDGSPVIIDFGLSKQYDENGVPESSTTIGYGTPGYAPLEQAEPSGSVMFQPATDIYALGATLYNMLTGKRPPSASDILNRRVRLENALWNMGVSQKTMAAILSAMSLAVCDRPQDVPAFLSLLGIEINEWGKDRQNLDEDETDVPVKNAAAIKQFSWLWTLLSAAAAALVSLLVFSGTGARISAPTGVVDGHGYVDLGLPSGVMWATCNVGAFSPSGRGDYFAWGEIEPKSTYTWENYRFAEVNYNNDVTFTKYNTESKSGIEDFLLTLEEEDDVASVKWKGSWRMPTNEEWMELKDCCNWTWTKRNWKKGCVVTGPNGNSIFLPAAGIIDEKGSAYASIGGRYWSSSLHPKLPVRAWYFFFDQSNYDHDSYCRYYGRTIRPVMEKE